ncbi:MAG: TetR/AcrR family transcriptional regulator [Phascolarctobacterium sp.]|uniref:TetR/AcrR family transcriptional regulator n=1 Tax=Phascolarctobacterium sp. TaxID=2049039 RepID=UPI0026DB9868|nr:TetR/AcrR family transcriptional regulator [Phascolarctobacterium sp.]MDO4921275.1 TetR/AcrR family transcriptional regulator [Phascolarctobacterium sp.]
MPAKKQITKQMILEAAFSMLKSGGINAVNVKALAKELNCSTQPIYLSFASMDALRDKLSSLAVGEFLQAIADKNGEINLYGIKYVEFAKKEKNLFRFLFMRPNAFSELQDALAPIMRDAIAKLKGKYKIDAEEAHRLHDQLWMHAHGVASMVATDFCVWDLDKAADMLAECHALLVKKYEAL